MLKKLAIASREGTTLTSAKEMRDAGRIGTAAGLLCFGSAIVRRHSLGAVASCMVVADFGQHVDACDGARVPASFQLPPYDCLPFLA